MLVIKEYGERGWVLNVVLMVGMMGMLYVVVYCVLKVVVVFMIESWVLELKFFGIYIFVLCLVFVKICIYELYRNR